MFGVSTLLTLSIKRFETIEGEIESVKKGLSDLSVENENLAIIDVFTSPEELYNRLLELTVDSLSVATTTTQALPKYFGPSGRTYFDTIHSYIKNQKIANFRRLVMYESDKKEKGEWMCKIVNMLKTCNNFSLGYIDIDELKHPITHFHLIHKHDDYYTFVINTPAYASEANAFLVKSKEIYEVALKHYNFLWSHSVKLKDGIIINSKELEKLAEKYSSRKIMITGNCRIIDRVHSQKIAIV